MELISAERVYRFLKPLVRQDVEEFWALAVGPKKELLRGRMLFRGTVDSCQVHPRELFRFACAENASALIIAHNHPSQDLLASPEDIRLTQQLIEAGLIFEIPIVDHLIITQNGFSSFARKRWCRFH